MRTTAWSLTLLAAAAVPAFGLIQCPAQNATSYTNSNGDVYLIECNIDHSGGDLPNDGQYVPSLDACIALCSSTSGCVDVSWVAGSPQGACYLKSTVGAASQNSHVLGAKLVSKAPVTTTSTETITTTVSSKTITTLSTVTTTISGSVVASPTPFCPNLDGTTFTDSCGAEYVIECGIDHSGGDIPNGMQYTTGLDTCIALCSSNPTCVDVSWVPGSPKGPCYIKSSLGAAQKNSNVWGARQVSGCQKQCKAVTPPSTGSLPNCQRCSGQPGTDKFCGFDINTDYYQHTPKTCNVVTYELEITNTTISPDGIERLGLLINGQMPGPTIRASWGDTVVVTVKNSMQNNGTSIHFHGVRQLNNNMNDGVPSITQCPIAPGESMTYTWVAENYGTSWYHSHFALQTWEGVFGPMIIDGPTSGSFDDDLGTFMLQDWTHATVDSMYDLAENATVIPGTNSVPPATFGGPQTMDNGLINGKNTWNNNGASQTVGSRLEAATFTSGKSYLLRIVNVAIQSTFAFSIDGHSLTVISADFVPIVPYTTDVLFINIGQRYQVIVHANQPSGNYWMRADNQQSCTNMIQNRDVKAIIRYSDAPTGVDPTSTSFTYTDTCQDEPYASLVPVVPLNAGPADFTEGTLDVVIHGNSASLFKWYLSGTTFFSEYDSPTLLWIFENNTVPDFSGNLLVEVPNANEMVYVIIETPIPLPHPIHLHGHDFWVLAAGPGTYSSSVPLNLKNPPRRDTALLPTAGYLVLAFITNNPGAWLMHCHIGWHVSMGFALQFVEQQNSIASSGAIDNSCTLTGVCKSWTSYATANDITVEDSGV